MHRWSSPDQLGGRIEQPSPVLPTTRGRKGALILGEKPLDEPAPRALPRRATREKATLQRVLATCEAVLDGVRKAQGEGWRLTVVPETLPLHSTHDSLSSPL